MQYAHMDTYSSKEKIHLEMQSKSIMIQGRPYYLCRIYLSKVGFDILSNNDLHYFSMDKHQRRHLVLALSMLGVKWIYPKLK